MIHRLAQVREEALGNTGLRVAQSDSQMNAVRFVQTVQAPLFV